MIVNNKELEATQERIRHFQAQVAHLRKVETNPLAYRLSASGFWRRLTGCRSMSATISPCIRAS